ncbi:putative amp-CoA ligase [Mycena sanguinolenta]|uniref:Putative amp-CoA ligase n=1 Tax=Mycena sanguinolenta TaxID=230812 RepID=A0A8H6X9H7_9AGAR|nr:putative amp-CoA ligase [Mycena sanguinolenta]
MSSLTTGHFLSFLLPVLKEKREEAVFKSRENTENAWMVASFGDLARHVAYSSAHWHHTLSAAGVVQKQVVGVWLTGRKYEDVVNIMGVSAAGFIPQLFSVVFPNPEVIWDLLSASGAKAMIFDAQFSTQCVSAPVPVFPAVLFPAFDSKSDDIINIAITSPTDTALIVHSSGTTSGSPRLIPLRHAWVFAMMDFKFPGALKQGNFDGADVTNTIGSLAHVGSFMAFVSAVYAGFTTVQTSSMNMPIAELLDLIKTCGLNRVALYAPFLSRYIKDAQNDPAVLSALQSCRQILHTGVSLNAEDENWAYENGLPITSMYGTSETAPLMTSVIGSSPADRLLRIIPGSTAKMVPYAPMNDGSGPDASRLLEVVLPPGENDSPHPSLFGKDNLYHTGDLFEEMEPGLYAFRGRSGDWLKTLGGFCDTKSIEDNVRKTCADLVNDVVVLGTNRPCPVLFAESLTEIADEAEKLALAKELIKRTAAFNQRLFLYERIENPKHIRVLPKGTLPRTKEKGNIRRNATEEQFSSVLDVMCAQ